MAQNKKSRLKFLHLGLKVYRTDPTDGLNACVVILWTVGDIATTWEFSISHIGSAQIYSCV
jgi:hypothetical protein